MISFDDLNAQNHRILELSNVLSNLIEERSMCDNAVTAELFFRYVDEVRDHLNTEEKNLYSKLLTHSDTAVNNTASLFLSGSAEIKRVFETYIRRWCNKDRVRIKDHSRFVRETKEMFEIVQTRIVDETEKLYPLVRRVQRAA